MARQDLESLLGEFLAEAAERTAHVEQLLLDLTRRPVAARPGLARRLRRELHTLKGNAGMMGFTALQRAAHELEELAHGLDPEQPEVRPLLDGVDRLRAESAALGRRQGDRGGDEQTGEGVHLSYERLEGLMELLGAQLLARHRMGERLAALTDAPGASPAAAAAREQCAEAWLELDRLLEQLQSELLDLRMVPVRALFGRLRRIVHDEADRNGKQARLDTRGGMTPVDRALIDAAGEVLGHLARNAVVHGIEAPERRRELDKQPEGLIRVEARVRSRSVQIDLLDDGGGIDHEALLRAAAEAGVAVKDDDDLQALMFHPGLTTRRKADLSAGRGVGMDVVLEGVRRVGGTIEVASRRGVGTRFRLRLPMSVAVATALLLEADGRGYALPVTAILHTLAAPPEKHGQTVDWRGRELPLLDLGVAFGSRDRLREQGAVVVIDAGGRPLALLVDSVRGPLEILVRGLDDLLRGLPGVAGSSVLGDGRVVLILEPLGLAALRPDLGEAA